MSQLNQTYENYLQQPEALSFTEMTTIYQEILKNADMNDNDFIGIWEELMGAAIRYTVIRAEWPQFSREQNWQKIPNERIFTIPLSTISSYWNASFN